jgi:4-oxalocrotonate tautomerase
MPYINLKLTPDGLTEEIKAELIEEFTDILVKKLGKNPATTVMVIDEVETENWGIGGKTVKDIRANKS